MITVIKIMTTMRDMMITVTKIMTTMRDMMITVIKTMTTMRDMMITVIKTMITKIMPTKIMMITTGMMAMPIQQMKPTLISG